MEPKPPEPKSTAEIAAAKLARFEALALVLLSLATVGTAWCSFQAAAWGGAAQGAMRNISRTYILITVLLASALFCGGTASKFGTTWIRRVVLAVGLAAFIFAAERLWLLPIRF
jgi:hypothetical protein